MVVTHASPGAVVYAKALFEAADEAGGEALLREVDQGLQQLGAAWEQTRSLRAYFLSATVPLHDRRSALGKLVQPYPALLQNFMRLLLQRGRMALLAEAPIAFDALLDARLGRIPVTLTTAAAVAETEFQGWTEKIRAALGGEPVVQHVVNPDIVAGAIIRVGDRVIDGSARRRLAVLRENIVRRGKQIHALQS